MPKKCENKNCTKQANFNYPDELKCRFCKEDALEGMINIKKKRCQHQGCIKQANFNYEGNSQGIFCSEHSDDDMINVRTKCEEPNCTITQSFGYEEEGKIRYCKKHRKDGMIDLKSKRCAFPSCIKLPNYNFRDETIPKFCLDHKDDSMINVKSKLCEHPDCEKRATYSTQGESVQYCATHALDGMVDVNHKKCQFKDCKKNPHYNFDGCSKALFCCAHKEDNMIDIYAKKCKTPLCTTQVRANTKYKDYCLFCFIHLFPDEPVVRNYKTKEKAVELFIKEHFPNFTVIFDKKIKDGCSKRRPDFILDLGYQVIIYEVDEDQHKSYDSSCENKRLMQLSLDLGHRPIVVIRFNPDAYSSDGKIIKSCWTKNERGICIVAKNKKKEWASRLDALKTEIEFWIETRSEKTVEIIELFFDI